MEETKKSAIFDLGNFDLAKANKDGVWVPVLHPVTREPIEGMRRKIMGSDSKIYKQAQADLAKKGLSDKTASKKLTADGYDSYIQTQHDNGTYILSRCIIEWEGHVLDGNSLPCDQGTKEMILDSEHWGWYRDDVDKDIHDRKNFLPNA
jgi:hypothetical protein